MIVRPLALALTALVASTAISTAAPAKTAAQPSKESSADGDEARAQGDEVEADVDEGKGKCTPAFPFTKKSARMQRILEKRLRASGLGKYIDKKILGVSLVDLSSRNRRYYAGINDNEMMYAASLSKIAILLSVVHDVNEGKLTWTHEYDTRLSEMITASSNTEASWGAKLVGLEEIERVMRKSPYCLYDEKTGGGLWVGRPYGPGSETNRDPLKDLSHAATARQAARFYTLLDEGLLVSKHWSFRMLGLMSPPVHHHKFVGGLGGVPGVVFLARKSGTWRNWHSDSALIQHHGRRYVAIGITEHKNGEQMMRELIKVLDDIIMDGAHRSRRENRQKVSLR